MPKLVSLPNPLSNDQITITSFPDARVQILHTNNKTTNNNIVLGLLSHFRPGKRIDRAIEALRYLPENFILVIGGFGQDEDYLKGLTSSLNLNHRVQFKGWIKDEEKVAFFRSIDVFVVASDFDCHPIVFVESILYSTPVVSVPNPVFIDNFPSPNCAFYSDSSDPKSLALAIKSFSKNLDSWNPEVPLSYILRQNKNLRFAEMLTH